VALIFPVAEQKMTMKQRYRSTSGLKQAGNPPMPAGYSGTQFLIFRTKAKNAAVRRRLCYVFYNDTQSPVAVSPIKSGSHQVIARHDF
jgi:hypothetical protein